MDERRSLNRVQGPNDADAAMVMGNSTNAWDRYYDMRFQQRNAAAAVTAMTGWRQGMLAGCSTVAAEQSDAIVLVDDDAALNADELA